MSLKNGEQNYKDYVFERVPCQTSMPRQDGACHQFTVFSREPYSVKVSDIQLQVQLKIMKLGENGQYTVLPENEPVVPLNNFLYSAYKRIELLVNGVEVYSNPDYQLTSYFTNLFHTSFTQRETTQASSLFNLDRSGEFNLLATDNSITANAYPALYTRYSRIDQSELLLMTGRLICAPFMVNQTLPEGLDFTIRLYPASVKECLHTSKADNQYSIHWIAAELTVPRVISKQTTIPKQIIPYTHPTVYTFSHQKDLQAFGPKQILSGYLPSKIIIGFQYETARLGSYRHNSLEFTTCALAEMVLTMNGLELPKKNAFKFKYNDTSALINYDDIYLSMFRELGEDWGSTTIPITRDSFKNGFFFLPINMLSGHPSVKSHTNKPQYGSCTLEARFNTVPPLKDNVSIVVYAEYDRRYTVGSMIKKQRNFEVHPFGHIK